MSDLYLGFRVEAPSSLFVDKNMVKSYNAKHKIIRMYDLVNNGRIIVDRSGGMVVAHGKVVERQQSNLNNFSLLARLKLEAKEIERIVKIINVLGNDKIIKERIETFILNKSALNKLAEFEGFVKAFCDIDSFIPNFTKIAWYYAPETKIV